MSGKIYFDDLEIHSLPHEFQVREPDSYFTGVLDPHGNRIYKSPTPVGFVTDYSTPKPRKRTKRK